MQLSEVMTHEVDCVGPDTTLQEAACKMRDRNIGPLPVCDHDRLIGMLTDRDIAVRAVAEGRDPRTTPVRESMTEGVDFCFEDEDVTEAAQIMQDHQIRRLIVLDRNKHLVGIVSLGDLSVKGDDGQAAPTLERVSEPAHPQ